MTALKRAIRDVYGDTLAQLGSENKDIVALDADVGSSSKSIVFGKEFPGRYFNVGIAEANMVAMAAGFATAGKIPFANTFAAFMVLRAGDPVADIVNPLTDETTTLTTTRGGRLFARHLQRFATAGMTVAKVAGSEAFRSGPLLTA